MPLHEMTAQPVAGAHCAFQIDNAAFSPLTNQSTSQRRGNRMDGKATLHHALYGETGAVHRDTLALLHAFVRRLYTQLHAVVQRNRVQSSHRVYDSGKHSRRSKTNNVSEPSGRRSTGIQRGASASGNAGTPGKAGTAPSPSHTGAWTQ